MNEKNETSQSLISEHFQKTKRRDVIKALNTPIAAEKTPSVQVNVAIIGGYSFFDLKDLLKYQLKLKNIECKIELGGFGTIHSEVYSDDSFLYQKNFDAIVILPNYHTLLSQGQSIDTLSSREKSEELTSDLFDLIVHLKKKTDNQIILSNCSITTFHELGQIRNTVEDSTWLSIQKLNLQLADKFSGLVDFLDLFFTSAFLGSSNFLDLKMHYTTKNLGSDLYLKYIADDLSNIISLNTTARKKVLVLDLDNTLWGGVIGDDGISGIKYGQNDPIGEIYHDFQKRIKFLKSTGTILCICSKNEEGVAKAPFEELHDMVLKLEDFALFYANWKPKYENIIEMSETLSLGLDSFVFVDDNIFEIESVNSFLPEVETLTVPENLELLPYLIEDSKLFNALSLTNEDLKKTDQYIGLAKAKSSQRLYDNMESYLLSLNMIGEFSELSEADHQRASQLSLKSNQFNLTGKRFPLEMVKHWSQMENKIIFTIRLFDKFTNHGLISCFFCVVGQKELNIENWVMSCRVLTRGLEQFAINQLSKHCENHGIDKITASYINTGKNNLVANKYGELGFETVETTSKAGSSYFLDVNSSSHLTTFITDKGD